jgi:hypothetical protein
MQSNSNFGFPQIVKQLIGDIVNTVADKPGLSPERKAVARQTAICTLMAFQPRDPVETMIAGQCIVYDHLLRDGARDMLRGQSDEVKIKARIGILSTGKVFLQTLTMLTRMQGRPEADLAFARQLETPSEPDQNVPVAVAVHEPVRTSQSASANKTSMPPREPACPDVSKSAPAPAPVHAPAEAVLNGSIADLPSLMSPEKIEEILLSGLTPEEKRMAREMFAFPAPNAVPVPHSDL